MTLVTPEMRIEILRRWDQREPLKVIADAVGLSLPRVSSIALDSGRRPRYRSRDRIGPVKLRPEILSELKRVARETHTSPEMIAREAIAAYLGHDQ